MASLISFTEFLVLAQLYIYAVFFVDFLETRNLYYATCCCNIINYLDETWLNVDVMLMNFDCKNQPVFKLRYRHQYLW